MCYGPCSPSECFDGCQCEACTTWREITSGTYYPAFVLAVTGIIAALYAWQNELAVIRLATELLRKHRVIVCCLDTDGQFIGEIETLPGVMAKGATDEEARTNTRALGLRVMIDRVRHNES